MPASTLTREHAWRASLQDSLHAWLELHHVDENGDPHTYRLSYAPDASGAAYLEPRVLSFGSCERGLSDRFSQPESSHLTVEIADLKSLREPSLNFLRAWLDHADQKKLAGVEGVLYVQRHEDRLAGNTPIPAWRGIVRGQRPLRGRRAALDLHGWTTSRQGETLKLPRVGDAFPGAPGASRERLGPLWYGRHSDAGSSTASPSPAAEASSGAGVGGGGVAVCGFGNLGGTTPTGLGLSEAAGTSQFVAGDDVRVWAQALNGSAYSEPSAVELLVVSTNGNTVTAAWDDMSADGYRIWIGRNLGGTLTWQSYVDVNGSTFSLAINSYASDAGALPPFFANIWYYTVTAIMADGETPVSNLWQGVSVPFRRPLRCVWSPVVGALSYRVYRRGTVGTFDRRFIVPATQLNGDGNVFFEDSLLDDDPTLAFITGITAPRGRVGTIHVGQVLDLAGAAWEAFALAGHAVSEVEALYLIDASGDEDVVTQVGASQYGVDFAAPNQPNFATYFSTVYHDAGDGTRWTLVYARGPYASSIVAGDLELRANLKGVESTGNGAGTFLTSIYDQMGHFADNHLLPDTQYAGGNWGTTPTWFDTTPRRLASTFTAAKATANSGVITDDIGTWGVTESATLLDAWAQLAESADVAFGDTKEGQLGIWLEPPDPDGFIAPVADLTEERDLEGDSLDWQDQTDRTYWHNRRPLQYDVRHDGSFAFAGSAELTNALSIADYGIRDARQPLQLMARASQFPAEDVGQRIIDRAAQPTRDVRTRGWLSLLTDVELGAWVDLTHSEGAGESGWAGRRMQVRRLSLLLDLDRVELGLRDLALIPTTLDVDPETVAASPSDQVVELNATVTAADGSTVNSGTVTFTVVDENDQVIGTPVVANVVGGAAAANYTLPGGIGV